MLQVTVHHETDTSIKCLMRSLTGISIRVKRQHTLCNQQKRLMHYAVPDKLREETDPITEWIIKKNDRKLIKYAIKQKYIGKENAGKLLEYAFSLKNVETDDWIIELLTEEMTGHKQQSVEKSVKTQ